MCLAIPGKVIRLERGTVIIDYSGEQREAIFQDIELKKGDYVLVQQGIVIQKVSDEEALESISAWKSLLDLPSS